MNVKLEPRLCAIIYLLIAVPALLCFAIITPTFHAPDETQHFIRAYQVSNFELFPTKRESASGPGYKVGGLVDKGIKKLNDTITSIAFDPEKKLSREIHNTARSYTWQGERWQHTPNVSIYPPFFYIPAAIGISIAKMNNLAIFEAVSVARHCNIAVGLAVACCAIVLSGESALLLTLFLLFPMVLSQMASASQDALMLPLAALLAAFLGKLYLPMKTTKVAVYVTLCAFCILLLSTSRPPYTALGMLLLAVAHLQKDRVQQYIVYAGGLITILCSFLWAVYVSKYVSVPFGEGYVSYSGQLGFIIANPLTFCQIIWQNISENGTLWMEQMVGVLGWLDTPLSSWYYNFTFILMTLVLLLIFAEKPKALLQSELIWSKSLIAAILIFTFAGLLVVFYIIWSPVGDQTVHGFQGRYMLPLFFLSTVLLKSDYRLESMNNWSKTRFFLLCLSGITGVWVSITSVFSRFYV